MKSLTTVTLSACLFLFSAVAMPQEKKMNDGMHKHMMQMMQDSTMMNMMMDNIAKDDNLHMKMMNKMMIACKSDTSKMMGMCKAMMEDQDMQPMMMKMMKMDKIKPRMIETKKTSSIKQQKKQENNHEEHHKNK